MRKFWILFVVLFLFLFAGCSGQSVKQNDGALQVVASAYPAYDFAHQIIGGTQNLKMLTRPGVDPHEYEPTPQNIIDLENCDVFIYNGGESDIWVDEILKNVENKDLRIIRMMDCVNLLEEETVEGMEVENSGHEEAEYDEHVWTSPRNVMSITEAIRDVLVEVDPENASRYEENTDHFLSQLEDLDTRFRDIVANAERTTIIFADRFPARYFTEEYGITYYAAFPGCSSQTEPSAATVAFLIDKVKEEHIPCVFTVPFSQSSLPQTISEATGASILQFHSFHNVSEEEFGSLTYLDAMKSNAEALERALND